MSTVARKSDEVKEGRKNMQPGRGQAEWVIGPFAGPSDPVIGDQPGSASSQTRQATQAER